MEDRKKLLSEISVAEPDTCAHICDVDHCVRCGLEYVPYMSGGCTPERCGLVIAETLVESWTKGKTVREVCEEVAGYPLDPMAYRIWGVDPDELYDEAAERKRKEENE